MTTTDHHAVPRAPERDVETADHAGEHPAGQARTAAGEPRLVEDELLVEDVSIDGMCGVY